MLQPIQPPQQDDIRNESKKRHYIIRDNTSNITHVGYCKRVIIGGYGEPGDEFKFPCGIRIRTEDIEFPYTVGTMKNRASKVDCEVCKNHLLFDLSVESDGLI